VLIQRVIHGAAWEKNANKTGGAGQYRDKGGKCPNLVGTPRRGVRGRLGPAIPTSEIGTLPQGRSNPARCQRLPGSQGFVTAAS
jgi:hypothetical protein